jgi:1-acyl-sn-glycerol-3-phosphate acyltransferase
VQPTTAEIIERVCLPGGCLLGFAIATLQRHPTRRRIWLPVGYGILVPATFVGYLPIIGLLYGIAVGLAASALHERAIGIFVLMSSAVAWFVVAMHDSGCLVRSCFALFFGVMFVFSLWKHRRPVGETLGEWLLRLMYRMRIVGPGVAQLPSNGSVLVIANHTAFLDPVWIMIPLPRDLTPIMYGDYFKKPGLHFYMKHIINAIPSGVGTVRRETPELDEAVRRLDRGEGVLVFPEGWVRRKEDEPVRRFAQGIWRILRDRPATPVVACWIEGGWGSWSSFQGGPPFKGKRLDIRRHIDVAVSVPVVLDAETLADQHKTRELLREMVIDTKKHLTQRREGAE